MDRVDDVVGDDAAIDRGPVRRYLVVGNATLASPQLRHLVESRSALGAAEFHVVVPCQPVPFLNGLVLGDPLSGYVSADTGAAYDPGDDGIAGATERLETFVALIQGAGATAAGEIGVADPVGAVVAALGRSRFDEIIVSTLPSAVSRWLRMDLPTRLRRATSLPVTHVEAVTAAA
jgi:hypothetical protein